MRAPSSDRAAISRIINGLIEAGCTPTVARDGENADMGYARNTKTAILDHLTSCDESVLFVDLPGGGDNGWVRFVLGNDPEEVAADYTTNLSDFIDPITDLWWE